ncbi:nucleoside/nucleotide kinase family protein [Ornithinimicrobium avium]|uniref:Uridine kinase n=1 Tax=Ornithinimicrobium avium TaxID=2283195 RepID=A0A345NIQ3_9MICO|nr:uridine kinase [Ornithinimicrobium avium]AXH94911.1 uridine kinase [Ornithinimicrobium avium]
MTAPGFLPTRQLVLVDLLGLMLATRPGERAVVAVDGPAGVGKTRLVGELVAIAPHVAGREVLSVSVDGFHHPRARRDADGRTAQTHYRDAFDYDALRRRVLRPFRAGREIVTAVHDVATDHAVQPDPIEPGEDALLIVEGVFLRRPELRGEWDATCLVTASSAGTPPCGDAGLLSSAAGDEGPHHLSDERSAGAQRLYQQQARLWQPTWIVDNSDLQRPELIVPDPEEPQWFDEASQA